MNIRKTLLENHFPQEVSEVLLKTAVVPSLSSLGAMLAH